MLQSLREKPSRYSERFRFWVTETSQLEPDPDRFIDPKSSYEILGSWEIWSRKQSSQQNPTLKTNLKLDFEDTEHRVYGCAKYNILKLEGLLSNEPWWPLFFFFFSLNVSLGSFGDYLLGSHFHIQPKLWPLRIMLTKKKRKEKNQKKKIVSVQNANSLFFIPFRGQKFFSSLLYP